MKKIILIGRTGCGKTSLSQALRHKKLEYCKTRYTNYSDIIIDTPGEYAENKDLSRALILYSYEADIVGLLMDATEESSPYSPDAAAGAAREVVGIVTQIDKENARPDMAENWLRLAGCKTIFRVSTHTGEGITEILDYLNQMEE